MGSLLTTGYKYVALQLETLEASMTLSAIKHKLPVRLYLCMCGLFWAIDYFSDDTCMRLFLGLLVIRYFRLTVGLFAYSFHRSVEVPRHSERQYHPRDVTAILPTVNPNSPQLIETIRSVCDRGVSEMYVILPRSQEHRTQWLQNHEDLAKYWKSNSIHLLYCSVANKRHQVSLALSLSRLSTKIVALVDDHVFWPDGFLEQVLAPFENDKIGGVAMWKRVRRNNRPISIFKSFYDDLNEYGLRHAVDIVIYRFKLDFCNFLGCLYLERHNFDITATHAIDGGMFVISGRTALYRSQIVCQKDFLREFQNETWGFGTVGPLNADDDNFITRWLVNKGWEIGWQHGPSATIETTIGDSGFKTFHAQCLRWVRTTWRSNSTTLLSSSRIWIVQPWCVYAVYLTSFINFALLMDSALVYLAGQLGFSACYMVGFVLLTKLIKPMPHFLRHSEDLLYFPFYILFGYYHSLLKLYALLTCWKITWGSRPKVVS